MVATITPLEKLNSWNLEIAQLKKENHLNQKPPFSGSNC